MRHFVGNKPVPYGLKEAAVIKSEKKIAEGYIAGSKYGFPFFLID